MKVRREFRAVHLSLLFSLNFAFQQDLIASKDNSDVISAFARSIKRISEGGGGE